MKVSNLDLFIWLVCQSVIVTCLQVSWVQQNYAVKLFFVYYCNKKKILLANTKSLASAEEFQLPHKWKKKKADYVFIFEGL